MIPVILAIGLIGLAAMILARTVALDIRVNAFQLREAEAESWANGLAQLAAYELAAARSSVGSGPLKIDGTPLVCRAGRESAVIEAFDAAGLVDINFAPQDVFEQLFVKLDVKKERAAQLAAAIVDFRSLNDGQTVGNIDPAQYAATGRAYGPKHAPFATTGELEQVLGMTRDLFSRVHPFVTTHSRMTYIDPNVASSEIMALQLPDLSTPRTVTRSFVIRAAVRSEGQTRFVREAVVELAQGQPDGFLLKEWTRLDTRENRHRDKLEAGSCLDILLSK